MPRGTWHHLSPVLHCALIRLQIASAFLLTGQNSQIHVAIRCNYPGGWAARLARGGAFGTCPALARQALGWFSAVMERADLERLSKDELIELVLRLQRPQKTSRTSSKPPSTDRKERREQARPGGAKPGHEGHS